MVNFHERSPYYTVEANGVGGIIGKRVMDVMQEAGVECQFKQTPPKRQLALIKANAGNNCILGWFKNPEREKFAQFSSPIYRDKPQVALVRSDVVLPGAGLDIVKLLEMKHMRLLMKDGYSYGAKLDALIEQYKPTIVLTGTGDEKMLKMIKGKRADYMFVAPEESGRLIQLSGLSANDFRLVPVEGMPSGNQRYLLFSKQVDKELVDRINTAIDRLFPEGG